MNLDQYLEDIFRSSKSINLIGPLYSSEFSFDGPTVYIDGGVNFKQDDTGFSLGDGDSSSARLDQTLNPMKSYSDLAYALQQISKYKFKELKLFGFLGGRKDHELINLLEVHRFLANDRR